ncbi:flagellar protein FlgN [Clostridium sp. SYSU_GA19001]|uniref:flagellar protein FlgN n=1 Tax=Clostridium caldaquaticum TaxID=2940653 RepID=UPI002077895D|nr:flagellar protein FlgN [Clostridium caldaquaticum]MCM8710953.1 flagellar protein FlgN [Clostridium caldaquaticum]
MKEELNNIISAEIEALTELIKVLETQHASLIKSDAITLESCVSEIEKCSRMLADKEVKRRELTKGRSMSEIVEEIGDSSLEENYRKMRILLHEAKVQKESNELLIKQGLSFTNRILNILNPSRMPKTYNSYGRVSR